MNLFKNVVGFLSFFCISSGALFKMMHWPLAGILLVAGVFMLNVGFLPVYFYGKYKMAA